MGKQNHHEVRKVWKLEDLLAKCNECARDAIAIYNNFRQESEPGFRFSHFRNLLEFLVPVFSAFSEHVTVFEDEGYPVEGINELRGLIPKLQDIIDEDRFAEDSSIFGGSLDDWE